MNIFLRSLLALLLLILVVGLLIQTSVVQNFIIHRVTKRLSKNLHTTVAIRHVDIHFFDKLLLEGALVLDQRKDTLLYAGTAKVNITDWFFARENIELKYIGLDDATIYLNRKDSVWNYQFLVDYFSSPTPKQKTDSAIALSFDVMELNRIKVWQRDGWKGQDFLVSLNKLDLHADEFDLPNKILKIQNILLDKPQFAQYDYTGNRPETTKAKTKKIKLVPGQHQWNEDGWDVSVKNIKVSDGSVISERESDRVAYTEQFDERFLKITDINGQFRNLRIHEDTITTYIRTSAKDRNGFRLNELSTDLVFTPDIMEFNHLNLVTDRSHLGNYFAMRYTDFIEDMNDFIDAVTIEGRFVGSKLNTEDLAYFAPETRDWNTVFELSGYVKGTVDNLKAKNLRIRAGGKNYLAGDVALRGLPDIDNTFIDLKASELQTSYAELVRFAPSLGSVTQPRLSTFGNISFSGNFYGFVNNFNIKGTLVTDIGSLQTDLNMRLPPNGMAAYTGVISTPNFELGTFLNNSQLGSISFSGKVDGQGVKSDNMRIAIDGDIRRVEFNGYAYTNIKANGLLARNLFSGKATINDPNIEVAQLDGSINFSESQPQFNLLADVRTLNLKNLHFTNDSVQLTGVFDLKFTGSNIDNFLGTANLYNASLYDNGKQLSFDSLVIKSSIDDGAKHLTLLTNEITADLYGQFEILELPDAFQLFLNRYYPAYIKKPRGTVQDQNFQFAISTNNISDYITLFDKRVTGFDNATLSGYLNVPENKLDLSADVPAFAFGGIQFNGVKISGVGNRDTLTFEGKVEDVIINDSLHSAGTSINIVASNDVSDVQVKTSANKTLNSANLSARVLTSREGFDLLLNPSTFTINSKQWKIQSGGRLELIRDMIIASDIVLSESMQKVYVSTEPSGTGTSNDVVIGLQNFDLGDVAPIMTLQMSLDGLVTGQLRVNDPFGKTSLEFDTKTTDFYFENDSIGVLTTRGEYLFDAGNLNLSVISDNYPYNFSANLKYRAKDSTEDQIRGNIVFNNSGIHVMEKYLGGIFDNIYGRVSGELNLYGNEEDPKLTGSLRLDSTSMTVDYTRCRYILEDNSILNFRPDEIDFGVIKIRDTLNRTATVTGKIYHSFFDNFFFNELHLKTDAIGNRPARFVLLNTTSNDNKQFYGHIIGDAELSLNGFVNDMRMNISGEPTDSSHIYLPAGETAESGSLDYIEFTSFGREMRADSSYRQNSSIQVDMDLLANPYAKIDVILDETTGDVIKAQGSGRLHITAGTSDPLTIRGRYEVEDGEYTFNFQTFLKTPFTLQTGYIEWQGDPYLANLNIDAVYTAEQVMLNNIPTSTGFANTKGDVNIIFKLRGTLADPRPEFEFQFPFDNPLKTDPIASEYIKTRFEADKNELNKQVTSLLLFNSFMSTDQRLLSSSNTGNFVTRSVGQLLSATLSSSLNNWLQKVLNSRSVNVYTNINTADFGFGVSEREIQNIGNFGLKTSFFNNKLLVKAGGNVDYRVGQASNSNSNFLFTPDVSFEYLVTQDGRVRVVGFNRSDADLGDLSGITRRNRTGVQLSYRKEFDSFTEFFLNNRRRKFTRQPVLNEKALNY